MTRKPNSSKHAKKRQLSLLMMLAAKAGGRHDTKVSLADVAPSLNMQVYGGGSPSAPNFRYRYVDKVSPKPEGGTEIAYDFNTLMDQALIQPTHLKYGQDVDGGIVPQDPAIMVTPDGFVVIEDYERSWLSKAIEKEPITFLQVVLTILVAIASWAFGRYITPVTRDSPVTSKTEMPKSTSPK